MKNLFIKTLTLICIVTTFFYACSSDENTTNIQESTETTPTTSKKSYDITPILSKFDNIDAINYTINGNTVTITTTNLPNHKSPYWPTNHSLYEAYNGTNVNFRKNPNTIRTQNVTFTIPLHPSEATNKEATRLGPIGVSINGVVFYNQYAGPNNQPLTTEINSFDQWYGHPQNAGQYHYHIEPTFLTNKVGKSGFLGLLADGFPVYGPEENGKIITSADLDEYHGHFGPTEDFPDGIYHYHITMDDPYINGNGYFGTPGNISR